MADFDGIVGDVYTITNRADLVAETQLAVKAATLQLHRSDFFFKDLLETAIEFSTSSYLQAVDYRTLFPLYRSLKYMRKFDGTPGGVGPFLKVITPEEVLDAYKLQRTDVIYVAGKVWQIKSSTQLQFACIGIYQNPDVSSAANYDSWIALEARYAVMYQAAANVFGSILRDSAGQQANAALAALEMRQIIMSNIEAQGE